MKKFIIVIAGATGVGKTDFSLQLGRYLPLEIVNADLGQFYTPLSIGTAKPDWKNEKIPHHLFDIFSQPQTFTIIEYRSLVQECVKKIWERGNIPVIVGGSTLYIESLFFETPSATQGKIQHHVAINEDNTLWDQLYELDPQRATEIHPHDSYRLKRALTLWYTTGVKPSEQKPLYNPIAPFYFYIMTRDRNDLYHRINQRVVHMMNQGWLEEVSQLRATPWYDFILSKKFIGYPEIIAYLEKKNNREDLIATIAQKTRNYAKKQETFWRRLEKKIYNCLVVTPEYTNMMKSKVIECNLTYENSEIYSKQQAMMIKSSNESNLV